MFKCLFGFHEYEIYKEEKYVDIWGHEIGSIIVSRCKHCGKITKETIKTVNNGW